MGAWKMAVRSVGRNRRRSLVTISAMTLAVSVMLLYGVLVDGILAGMERNAVSMDTGQVQVHKAGYREDPDLYGLMPESAEIVARLEGQGLKAAPRLYGAGLGASGTASAGVSLRGVDVRREAAVTTLARHLAQGAWLEEAQPDGVVLGGRLARSLGVGVGDEVVVLGQASDGSMANEVFRVRGVLKGVGEEIDRAGVLMTEGRFRALMAVPEGAHEVAVVGELGGDLEALRAQVRAAAPGQEVLHWQELQPVLAKLLESSRASMAFMIVLTYIAIAMVVFNAMLMSVFERIREFGVLKALGMTPWRLAGMIFVEAGAQVCAASVVGLGLGLPWAWALERNGLDLSGFTKEISFVGVAVDPVFYGLVTPKAVAQPVVFLFLLTGLAVLYPAAKAALIKPVEAFRHT